VSKITKGNTIFYMRLIHHKAFTFQGSGQ